jgi:hypothetical protein
MTTSRQHNIRHYLKINIYKLIYMKIKLSNKMSEGTNKDWPNISQVPVIIPYLVLCNNTCSSTMPNEKDTLSFYSVSQKEYTLSNSN